MNLKRCIIGSVLILFVLANLSYSQEVKPDFSNGKKWSAGLGFEYFKRTMSWDEDSFVSPLKSYLMTFHVNYKILDSLCVGGIS